MSRRRVTNKIFYNQFYPVSHLKNVDGTRSSTVVHKSDVNENYIHPAVTFDNIVEYFCISFA